jgi:hypothetical protein
MKERKQGDKPSNAIPKARGDLWRQENPKF